MTSQILGNELTNLISESKRKNTDLRNAAEKSLQDLKALPSTSEQQLAADLIRRPAFVSPFLLACGTKNSRLAGIGISCLQRLIASHGLPKERLEEVLEAFKESASLGLDVQLKILQALPPLLQGYADELNGELLANALQVCSMLQTVKSAAVSNTAAATLQQLFTAVYEKVAKEDASDPDGPFIDEISTEEGPIAVRGAARDAYKKPQYVHFSTLPQASCLEIIEAILTSHSGIFATHDEQEAILRLRILPLTTRCLSEKLNFTVTLRIFRILSVILRKFVSQIPAECEIPLGLLNHMLDGDVVPAWKRNLCMEIFRSLYTDYRLFLELFTHYDSFEGRKSIIKDNFAAFVRLATEKPAKIGLGQQSTAPIGSSGTNGDNTIDQAAVEAGGVAGVIGTGGLGVAEVNVPGISVQLSSLKTPCLDQLDKVEAPAVPETYVYSLVLTCLTSVSDGLAKCVLPMSIHQISKDRRKKKGRTPGVAEIRDTPLSPGIQDRPSETTPRPVLTRSTSYRIRSVPLNPLDLVSDSSHEVVKVAANLINECWPAVLATCSTFLYAALDAEFYHSLVRSIQKFTQVAGVLRLSTPRDAFLTTLGKAAVPPNLTSAVVSTAAAPNGEGKVFTNAKGLLSVDSIISQTSSISEDRKRRQSTSIEADMPNLTTRNLLCLRALINLAIALGPTLETAWSIVLETLQSADIVLAAFSNKAIAGEYRTGSSLGTRNEVDPASASNLNAEIKAVETASSRMFDNTGDYPDDAFLQVLKASFGVFFGKHVSSQPGSPAAEEFQRPIALPPRRVGSISSLPNSVHVHSQEYTLALNKIREISRANHMRLVVHKPAESGWDFLMSELIKIAASITAANSVRGLAADILRERLFATADSTRKQDTATRSTVQRRVLLTLQSELDALMEERHRHMKESDFYVLETILETLKDVLDACGESLIDGWASVFKIISSVFERHEQDILEEPKQNGASHQSNAVRLMSGKLGRIAFVCTQIVYSECRGSLPTSFLSVLSDTLLLFTLQFNDLNMSLTTISIFQDVSEFLQKQVVLSELENLQSSLQADAESPTVVIKESAQVKISAVWLSLLRHLTTIAGDERSEVRYTAVRTILTIFDHYGELLSSSAWSLLISTVLFKLIDSNTEAQRRARTRKDLNDEDIESWDGSSKIILGGVAEIFSGFLQSITRTADFSNLWQTMMAYFEFYLSFHSHSLNASVFKTLTTIMSKAEGAVTLGKPALNRVGTIWASGLPTGSSTDNAEAKQEAFIAYTRALQELCRLTERGMTTDQISTIVDNLEQCVRESDGLSYSGDIDFLTPLQKEVLDIIRLLRTDLPGAPSTVLEMLAAFVSLPFDKDKDDGYKTSLTFVALSKTAMRQLGQFIEQHSENDELYTSDSLASALASLVIPINLKYKWRLEGNKAPPPWQLATSTVLAVLHTTLRKARTTSPATELRNVIAQAVSIAENIAAADISTLTSRSKVQTDVEFDIESFKTLHNLLVPYLGSTSIPSSLRKSYTQILFRHSLIHSPEPEDLPRPSTNPLSNLSHIRFGRTSDPAPSPRRKLSYLCLNFLLQLVRKPLSPPSDTSAVRTAGASSPTKGENIPALTTEDPPPISVPLARSASPYLLLRAALPLKSYIADQPLRGRMPQPESQRQELLFVLRELRTLETVDKAISHSPNSEVDEDDNEDDGDDGDGDGDGDGEEGKGSKKHLLVLYPLVVQALGVAGRVPGGADAEVLGELRAFLEEVGRGFGGKSGAASKSL